MLLADERDELCRVGRAVAGSGLVRGSAGNLSVRSGDLLAITPAGARLERMRPLDCPVLDLAGRLVDGERVPSSETPMHRALYEADRPGAIVHTHSTFATAVSTVVTELPHVHYYAMQLGGAVRVAPYATYGTPELAENVRLAIADRHAALLANHGGVAVGNDLGQALERAELLEWLCEVYVRAKSIGEPRVLTAAEYEQVVARWKAG